MPHNQTKNEEDKQIVALPSPVPSGTCTMSLRATSTDDLTACATPQRQSITILQASECEVPNELRRNMEESNRAVILCQLRSDATGSADLHYSRRRSMATYLEWHPNSWHRSFSVFFCDGLASEPRSGYNFLGRQAVPWS